MRKSIFVVSLFSLLLVFPSLTQAQTKSIFIPAYAFHPMYDESEWNMGGGELYLDTTSIYAWFTAHVMLPDGARITKVVARAYDNGPATFLVGLYRRNMYTNLEDEMAEIYTAGADPSWRSFIDDSVHYWTINNSGYGYYVCVNFGTAKGSEYRIEGIKIVYLDPIT